MKDIIKSFLASSVEQKEFVELTSRLMDVMVDFSLLTLNVVQKKMQAPLNAKQIEDVINFDLQFRLQQINDPGLLDIVREIASSKFMKEQK